MSSLLDRLHGEADLCRNEGANDIAALLDDAARALKAAVGALLEILPDAEHEVARSAMRAMRAAGSDADLGAEVYDAIQAKCERARAVLAGIADLPAAGAGGG